MNRNTFERIVESLLEKCQESDYPLCYTKHGQILNMNNMVFYIGKVDDSRDISSEVNRLHYQGENNE